MHSNVTDRASLIMLKWFCLRAYLELCQLDIKTDDIMRLAKVYNTYTEDINRASLLYCIDNNSGRNVSLPSRYSPRG